MKTRLLGSVAAAVITLAACGPTTETEAPDGATVASTEEGQAVGADSAEIVVTNAELEGNPLIAEWDTPFGVPPFSSIETEHFLPAIKAGILEQRADIETITSNPEPASFENTLVALDTYGRLLDRVSRTFSNIAGTESSDEIRALQTEISPMLTREFNSISFNQALFQRINSVYEARGTLDLDEQEARLLELTHRDFVRAGAALPEDAKAQVADLNTEISALTTEFGQNLLQATKSFSLEITDTEELAGLSESFKAAIKVDGEDKWVVGLNRTPFETFMTQSENRELRRQLLDGYRLRASSGEFDNGPIAIKIAQLRAKRAELMGYPSHAAYTLETRMAKTPKGAEDFLLEVWRPGLARAKEERADMQALLGEDTPFEAHDWWHYSEKVRQERFAFDDNLLKPYFELEAVRGGAFELAKELFQVSFAPVDIPVWNDVVTAYEVTDDASGDLLGTFMMDMYARESKRGGAWMSAYREASDIDGNVVRPLITNNMNLLEPPEGEPTLMRFDEVETLFHEFGHGLHGLLTQIRFERYSGVDGPRDYTEFPAQILEHWASQPELMERFAKHYETGEVIPSELVEKMRNASTFNQGFRTTEFIAASLLDLAWHNLSSEEADAITDARAFEKEVLDGYGLIPEIEPRYRSQYFAHIFSGGYSAGYYSYLWSEILDADGFYAFKEAGDVFDPEIAQRLKKWVYESGGLRPADELYRNFRGSDPSIDPLLEIRGFKAPESEG
ncbi:MAG: M3 family metallopeptidase [Pseudomonadota bacterium]